MDIGIISIILSTATAIAAIVGPIISAWFTVRSNERMKHMELHAPHVYESLRKMIFHYSNMTRLFECNSDDPEDKRQHELRADADKKEFLLACYEVMSLIPCYDIHQKILTFMQTLNYGYRLSEDEAEFQNLISDISFEIALRSPKKKKRVARKKKHARTSDIRKGS